MKQQISTQSNGGRGGSQSAKDDSCLISVQLSVLLTSVLYLI